jgi:dTDP-4-dehydrorhamnose 3,5-epimerase
VIGDGRNFVQTMLSLAKRGIDPSVVNDQSGRLTFACDLAHAIRHLLESDAPYGTYNVTGSGAVTTWAHVARRVFAVAGYDPDRITGVTTSAYFADSAKLVAPRPRNSVLDLTKIASTGWTPGDADQMLEHYVRRERTTTDRQDGCFE